MKQTRIRKGAAFGIIAVMVSAMLLASMPTVSASEELYGDANGDGKIDMRDVTYVGLIILGKKPANELADANQDGRVNVLDITYIELIILGKVPEPTPTLRIGTTRKIKTTNLMSDYWYGILAMIMSHDTLVRFDPDLNIIPQLAERWESSEDGKVWKFYIAENARWHDGKTVTPEDVKFSYEYYAEKNPKMRWLKDVLDRIDIEDDAVVMYLNKPYGRFLTEAFVIRIVPKHIWENVDDPLKYQGEDATIGGGPFVFEKFDKVAGIVSFKANRDYYKGKPNVDRVEFHIYKTTDTLTMALVKGEVDAYYNYATGFSYPYVPKLLKAEDMRFLTTTHIGIPAALGFNLEKYPLNVREFREAITYGMNYKEINEYIFAGYGATPSAGFVPPSMPNYNPNIRELEYNPEKAKEMLDVLGFKDTDGDGIRETGDGTKLSFTLLGRTDIAEHVRMNELLKRDLEEIGIEIRVKGVDTSTWIAMKDKKEYDLVFFRTTPWGMLMHAGHGSGYFDIRRTGAGVLHNLDNEEFLNICDEILQTTDPDRIKELNYKLQEIYAEQLPAIALCWTDMVYPYRANWEGWVVHMLEGGLANHFSWFSIKPVAS